MRGDKQGNLWRHKPGFNRSRTRAQWQRRKSNRRCILETLEARNLLAAISWDGGGGNLLWSNPDNWDDAGINRLPTAADDVVIDVEGQVNVQYDLAATQVQSLYTTESLTIDAGQLTVGSGDFFVGSGATLAVDGAGTTFSALGESTIDGANITVAGGAEVSLPGAVQYRHASTGNGQNRILRAVDADSRLELGGVERIVGGTHYDSQLDVQAIDGGQIDLSSVVQIIDPDTGDTRWRRIDVSAVGSSSQVDLSSLQSVHDRSGTSSSGDGTWSTLTAVNDGTITAPVLSSLQGVNLTLDATGNQSLAAIESINSGGVTISGADRAFTSLTDMTGATIQVSGADVDVDLSDVTMLRGGSITLTEGGAVDLSSVSNIDGANIQVSGGVTLALPAVTRYSHQSTGNNQDRLLRASGTGSVLDLSAVTLITGGTHYDSQLDVQALDGGEVDLSAVMQISDPFAGDTRYRRVDVTADGANSHLDLTALVQFTDRSGTASSGDGTWSTLTARAGAAITSPNLAALGGVMLSLDSTSSQEVSSLAYANQGGLDLDGFSDPFTGLTDLTGASVSLRGAGVTTDFSTVTGLNGSVLSIDGVAADFSSATSLQGGSVTLASGGTVDLASVSNIDNASLYVGDGVTLALPGVTSYSHRSTANGQNRVLQATGAGSTLDLGAVTTITGGTHYDSQLDVRALDGGEVDLSSVVEITDSYSGDTRWRRVDVASEGANSHIDFSGLVSFSDRSGYTSSGDLIWSTMATRDGGAISSPNLTSVEGVFLSLDAQSNHPVASLQSMFRGALTLDGYAQPLSGLTDVVGTVVNIAGSGVTTNFQTVTSLRSSRVTIDGVSVDFSNVTTLREGALTLQGGGTVDLASVADIDNASLIVNDGVTLAIPGVTDYTFASTANGQDRVLRASGENSLLDLSGVTTVIGGTHYDSQLDIEADGGGFVDLSAATQIVDPRVGDNRWRRVDVLADGQDSEIDLSNMVNFVDRRGTSASGDGTWSTLSQRNGGVVQSANLILTRGVNFDLPTEGTAAASRALVGRPFIDVTPSRVPAVIIPFNAAIASAGAASATDVFWVGGDGNWEDTANWSSGEVPGSGSHVTIDVAGDVTVTISGNHSVASITSEESIAIATGSLAVSDASIVNGLFTMLGGTSLRASGPVASFAATGTTQIDGANLFAVNGGEIDLLNAQSYSHGSSGNGQDRVLRASGIGSVLNLSGITAVTGGSHYDSQLDIQALAGGRIDLSSATEISDPNGGDSRWRRIDLVSAGTGSEIELGQLTSFSDQRGTSSSGDGTWSTLTAHTGGSIDAPLLTTLINTYLKVDGSGVQPTNQFASITGGGLNVSGSDLALPNLNDLTGANVTIRGVDVGLSAVTSLASASVTLSDGGTADFSGVTNIDGASLYVHDGVTLALPGVTSYSHDSTANGQNLTLQASGFGTVLDLSNVTTITGGTHYDSQLDVAALSGGQVDLSSTTQISDPSDGDSRWRRIDVASTGFGSEIDLGLLASFTDQRGTSSSGDGIWSTIQARLGGTINAPVLSTLQNVYLTLDGSGTQAIAQLGQLTGGGLNVSGDDQGFSSLVNLDGAAVSIHDVAVDLSDVTTMTRGSLALTGGGTVDVTAVTTVDGASLYVDDGVTLALPGVTSYSHASTGNGQDRVMRVSGSGSLLDLSNVTSIAGGTNYDSQLDIEARAGGRVDLSAATEISDLATGDTRWRRIDVSSTGANSQIRLDALTTFTDRSGYQSSGDGTWSTMSSFLGGQIEAPNLTTLDNVSLTLNDSGSQTVAQLESLTGGGLTVNFIATDFPSLTSLDRANVLFRQEHVGLSNVTSMASASLTLIGGATVDLSAVTNIDNASLDVNDGVTLVLPNVTAYSHASTANGQDRVLRATGPGSLLDLSSVTQVTGGTHYDSQLDIEALFGGHVDLQNALAITDPNSGDTRWRRIDVTSDGAGSLVALNKLTNFEDVRASSSSGDGVWSTMNAIDSGAITVANSSLVGVQAQAGENAVIDGSLMLQSTARLIGQGEIDGNVTSAGYVAPVGQLNISGDYQQTAGTLAVDLAGPIPGQDHDQLIVSGIATVGGLLNINRTFTPTAGDQLTIIVANEVDGQFAQVTSNPVGDGIKLEPEYAPGQVNLRSIVDAGPKVVGVTPIGQFDNALTHIDISFDEAIDLASFDGSDVTATGPDGLIAVNSPTLLQANTYRVTFEAQITPGNYSFTVGPEINDLAGNPMDQDGDTNNGEPIEDVFATSIELTENEDAVLFVNVDGSYDGDGANIYQTILQAGGRAKWVNLNSDGAVADALAQNEFDQVWIYDLSSASDAYPTDWTAIADWYNAETDPAIIADSRIISSYWNSRWTGEGRRLSENYYRNLMSAGGGLLLGTDHNEFHTGINSVNTQIGIEPFSGNFSLSRTPVDTNNPLMNSPNDMGIDLFDDSTPGLAPFGLQPNGSILYTVAWHSGDFNTPGISSTIAGTVGFQVDVFAPVDGAVVTEGQTVAFEAQQESGVAPFVYGWSSDIDGSLGSGETIQVENLTPGTHQITLLGEDAVGGADTVTITLIVNPIPATVAVDLRPESDSGVSDSDNITNVTTVAIDVVVNRDGTLQIDFDGDGEVDQEQEIAAAGTYSFTSLSLADGEHLVRATMVPPYGSPISESLAVTVDTIGPETVSGAETEQAPAYSRDLQFNEPVDSASVAAGINGPGGPVTVDAVSGDGDLYLVEFGALIDVGTYTLTADTGVIDLAGNPIDTARRSDHFELLADVTGPVVTEIQRTGLIRGPVDSLTVHFDEAIAPDSFDAGDVTITGPTGVVVSAIATVQPIDGENFIFEVLLATPQAIDGDYLVSIGIGITDLTGNPVQAPFDGEFTIQLPLPIPPVPGDGVYIELFNGIGGGRAPLPTDIAALDPDGTTLSPEIDFPRPGNTITVGDSFTSFFSSTTTPPDEVAELSAQNFILRHEFFVAIHEEMDLDPETDAIDIQLGVGSDDGFHFTVDQNFVGSGGDRPFQFSWFGQSFDSAGLYPVSLLFAANATGRSGLEFWWNTALSEGNQLVPQQYLYVTPVLGDQTITFEELPIATSITDQYRDRGILFNTVGGNPEITNLYPSEFVPISPSNVFADPIDTPAETGEVDLTFVLPGTNDPATTNFVSLYVIDAEEIGATVTAYDAADNVVYTETVNAGGATQHRVTIQAPAISRVQLTLGQGTDTAAIDNITFNTPVLLNLPPDLVPIDDQSIDEHLLLTFTASATDPDQPDQQLRYSLAPGAPAGASVSSITGVFTWTPGESQGPGDYEITVVAQDNGSPSLSDTSTFSVQVGESNVAPTIAPIGDVTLTTDQLSVEFFASASDSDLPVQTLSFSLLPGAPEWASIDPASGSFSAAIDELVSDGSYPITVQVTDNAAEPAAAVASFNVIVDTNRPDLTASQILPPESLAPGDPFTLAWLLHNEGSETVSGQWVERVSISNSPNGSASQLLGTFNITDPINPNADPVQRSETFVLPATSLSGDVYFVIDLDLFDAVAESDEANRFVSETSVLVASLLSLDFDRSDVTEGGPPAKLTVTRSGITDAPLDVSFAASVADQLSVPGQVTIPAGQNSIRIDIAAIDDQVTEATLSVDVTASASGFVGDVAAIAVNDNDTPILIWDIGNNTLDEGVSTSATITRSFITPFDLNVVLTPDTADQLQIPTVITIPGGTAAVEFDIQAVDDDRAEPDESIAILAAALGYSSAQAFVSIVQSDVPLLGLSLAASELPEGSVGPLITGTLTRDPANTEPLIVALQVDLPGLVDVPATVTIPAGQPSADFAFAVSDDSLVNGSRNVQFQARAMHADGDGVFSGSLVTTSLEVLDNDGPTLSVEFDIDLLNEGAVTLATIHRNTGTDDALVVDLAVDDESELQLGSSQITIPQGKSTVTVEVIAADDGVSDGNQVVTMSASAAGFNSGVATLVVSDIDLPDLVVEEVVGVTSGATDESVDVNWKIRNNGLADAQGTWTQRLYLSADDQLGGDTLIGQYAFTGPISVGQSYDRTVPVSLPSQPGTYYFLLQVDATQAVAEGLETNNHAVSAQPVVVSPAYTAIVSTDVEMAPADTPVPLSGSALQLDGSPAAFVEVAIQVAVRNTLRVLPVVTDVNGNFNTLFRPLPGEGGLYSIAAAHPGQATVAVQDTFSLVGMRATPPSAAIRVIEQETVTVDQASGNAITIRNLSEIELTGLKVEVRGAPANLDVSASISAATILPAMGTVPLEFQITALTAATQSGVVELVVSSNESSDLVIPVSFTVVPLVSSMVAQPSSLQTSMAVGNQTSVTVQIRNDGGAATGPLQVLLPSGAAWLTLATSGSMPSLEPGEQASMTLLLTPPADLPLTAYAGSLIVRGTSEDLTVPFDFRAVSEQTGDLRVTVVDEYFYFTSESPLVTGAKVIIRDAIDGTVIVRSDQAQSPVDPEIVVSIDDDGRVTFSGLPAGPYTLEVRSPDHQTYQNTIEIDAGTLQDKEVFVSQDLVKYVWTVEEIEVEDRTRVTVESVFETNVPAPVVSMEYRNAGESAFQDGVVFDLARLSAVGQSMQIDIKVTNHGLIAAEHVAFEFGSHPFYEITPLIDEIGTLPAKSELIVPVTIRRIADAESFGGGGGLAAAFASAGLPAPANAAAANSVPCTLTARLVFSYLCGPNDVSKAIAIAVINIHTTCSATPSTGGGGGGGRSGPGGVAPVSIAPIEIDCDFCLDLSYTKDISGLFKPIISAAESAVNAALTPTGVSVSLKVKAEAKVSTCCDTPLGIGLEFSGSAGVTGSITVGPGINKSISLSVDRPEGTYTFAGSVFFGAQATPTIGVNGSATSGCNLAMPDVTVGGSIGASFQAGASGSVTATFAPAIGGEIQTEVVGVSGRLAGGVNYSFQYSTSSGTSSCLSSDGIYLEAFVSAFGIQVSPFDDPNTPEFENRLYLVDPVSCADGATADAVSQIVAGQHEVAEYAKLQKDAEQRIAAARQSQHADATDADSESADRGESEVLGSADLGAHAGQATAEQANGVCAQVRLQIEQDVVLTRTAFEASLDLTNNSGDAPLEDLEFELYVYDADGAIVNELFGVFEPELAGLNAVDGTGFLAAGSTGSASWVLLPTDLAAVSGPTEYTVGGVLSFTYDGLEVIRPFIPVTITVQPDAALGLKYFHQRDVISDDPHTDDIVESAEPFSLAVLVENMGVGTANNFRIESSQPKIIENEKGLLIDFEIIGTKVNGQDVQPSLTADIGNLVGGQTAVAEFLLESTLQGLFVDYEVTFEHISPFGQRKLSQIGFSEVDESANSLSLVKSVEIFELIRTVNAAQIDDDGLPDFLTNDVPDASDLPDTLHLSDGTVSEVVAVLTAQSTGTPSLDDLTVAVTADPVLGWSYSLLSDPSDGDFILIGVERSDGTSLPAENFWQTDRTFIGGGDRPILENNVHIVDHNSTGSYSLIFSNGDLTGPQIVAISGVVPNPTVSAVDSIDVDFSEQLDNETFDLSDVVLSINGAATPWNGGASIVHVGGGAYQIQGLAALTGDDAVYEVAVDASGVTDRLGNVGTGMQTLRWVKGEAAPALIEVIGLPIGLTNTTPTGFELVFTESIELSSLTADDFVLSHNGATVPNGSWTFDQVGDRTYRASNLGLDTQGDGDFEISFDAALILDLDGLPGIGQHTVAWSLDSMGPIAVKFRELATNPRNTVAQQIDLEFSEPIDLESLDVGDLMLVRDGGSENLIADDSRVTFEDRGNNRYRIGGINWVQAFIADPQVADFTISFDGSGIVDMAGNHGNGLVATTWTIDLDAPDEPSELAVSTFSGPVVNGIVNSRIASVSGSLVESGLTVSIRDLLTDTELIRETIDADSFDLPIEFPSVGEHVLRVRVVDPAGNVTDTLIEDLFVVESEPTVLAINGIPEQFIRSGIESVEVVFVDPVTPGSFTWENLHLSRNGGPNLIISSVQIVTMDGGKSFQIEGLTIPTTDEGRYQFDFDFGSVTSMSGLRSSETQSFVWRTDTTAPTSTIELLDFAQSSGSFTVRLTGNDPDLGAEIAGSGIESYSLYASDFTTPFLLVDTLSADQASVPFVGQPNKAYVFRVISRDAAGNLEMKPLRVEAWTYVPDVFAPVTQVDAVDSSDATFQIEVSGTDSGDALRWLDLYVQVDDEQPNLVATVAPGGADESGVYRQTAEYQAIADGTQHDYRFFSVGRDSFGNEENPPLAPEDIFVSAQFGLPAAPEVTQFDVQKGGSQRSFVRHLDLVFNSSDQLDEIVESLADDDFSNDRIDLTRFALNGSGSGQSVSLDDRVAAVDQALEIDFGVNGIGGDRNSTLGDGYYRLRLDLDDDGDFDTELNFFRLLGDTDGDGKVDTSDLTVVTGSMGQAGSNLPGDLNGDGRVNVLDRLAWMRGRGNQVGLDLPIDD